MNGKKLHSDSIPFQSSSNLPDAEECTVAASELVMFDISSGVIMPDSGAVVPADVVVGVASFSDPNTLE